MGVREGVIYGQFGGPSCRWAVCPEEGCNGEEIEATSLDKPRRTIGLFECRRQVRETIIDCIDQEVGLFPQGKVNQ